MVYNRVVVLCLGEIKLLSFVAKGNCFVKLELLILQGVRSMSMLKEFREFAMRGNVVDLAVGVIIGAAFGKIVSSFVADIIMPLWAY